MLQNRIPTLIGWGKGWNVAFAGWQVTLWSIYHVSSHSRNRKACCELLYLVTLFTLLYTMQLLVRSSGIGPVSRLNKEYLSQIQLYSIFGELPVISNTVLIITVCVKVANSTFLVKNKRTKWAELSRYYLRNCFVILDCWRLTVTWCIKILHWRLY